MLKIKRLVLVDIEPEEFIKECKKFLPDVSPKFKQNDIVLYSPTNPGDSRPADKTAALVSSVDSRDGKKWTYQLIVLSNVGGNYERLSMWEDNIELYDEGAQRP